MRVQSLLTLGVFCAAGAFAQDLASAGVNAMASSGESPAAIINGPRTRVSMYIWSDKYTYTAGQSLTLKWTIKTNGDLYPYTVFVYRQNNQTGKKTFFPGGGGDPTDINGNTA